MKLTSKTVKAAVRRDGPEVARSFIAGAGYMAAVVAIGAVAVTGAAGVATATLPGLIDAVAPSKFPQYAAHKIDHATRWNPDRWDTEIAGEHGNNDSAEKVASVHESESSQAVR